MYAAISGLKSHMNKLNVIGNNIANINTYGYKSGRTVFQTELYTTMKNGSNGTSTTGGMNPSQIGYGATVGSIDIDMSTGTYSPTGKSTDCMIDGDGFFLVGDKSIADTIDGSDASTLKALTLTRVGDFEFKADGYLTDGQGNVVYGFLTKETDAEGNPIVSDQLVPIRYPGMKTETDATTGKTTYTIMYPQEDGTTKKLTNATDANNNNEEYPFAQFDSISIDSKTGKISGICKDNDQDVTIGFIAIGNVTNPNGVTQESGTYYRAGDGAGDLTISLLGGVAADLTIDTAGTKLQYVNASSRDTAAGGTTGSPEGMRILSAGTTGLITGGLEMSKTDLATEISEMITTQRGYQANTRIITVTDSMLEELVNMKR
jgi:flagellar hook protein FlgE